MMKIDAVLPRFLSAFTIVIAVFAGEAAPSLAAAADETAAEFIRSGANDVLAEMRSAASLDQKGLISVRYYTRISIWMGSRALFSARIGAPRAQRSSKSSELSWKNTSRSPTVGALQRPAMATSA